MERTEQRTPTAGVPQGAMLSPLPSDIHLDPLDPQMAASGFRVVRCADDLVILCKTKGQARAALEAVAACTASAGLTPQASKTRLVDSRVEPFEFLGCRFERGRRYPRDKGVTKIRDTIRAETRRTDGRALPVIVADVNRTLGGGRRKSARRVCRKGRQNPSAFPAPMQRMGRFQTFTRFTGAVARRGPAPK